MKIKIFIGIAVLFILVLSLNGGCMSKADKATKRAMESYLKSEYSDNYILPDVSSVSFRPLKKKAADGKTVYKVTFKLRGTDCSSGKPERISKEMERYLKEIGTNQFKMLRWESELKEVFDESEIEKLLQKEYGIFAESAKERGLLFY